MKRIEYKIVIGDKGFKNLEDEISNLMTEGWKTIGGLAFNAGFAYQAIAKTIDVKEVEKKETNKNTVIGASQAMKMIDDLT